MTDKQLDYLIDLLDHNHQFECLHNDSWIKFERIANIYVDNNLKVMFSLQLPQLPQQLP